MSTGSKYDFSNEIVQCIAKLWSDEDMRDFYVEVDNVKFHCHSFMLAACSEFFRRLLHSSMKEVSNKRVDLHGISKETFELILEVIYKGRYALTEANLIDIWHAADLLQIEFLTQACERFAIEHISLNNYEAIYTFAEYLQSAEVLRTAYEFVIHNFEHFRTTQTFLKLPFDGVFKMIKCDKLVVKTEDSVVEAILAWVNYSSDDSEIDTAQAEHEGDVVEDQHENASLRRESAALAIKEKKRLEVEMFCDQYDVPLKYATNFPKCRGFCVLVEESKENKDASIQTIASGNNCITFTDKGTSWMLTAETKTPPVNKEAITDEAMNLLAESLATSWSMSDTELTKSFASEDNGSITTCLANGDHRFLEETYMPTEGSSDSNDHINADNVHKEKHPEPSRYESTDLCRSISSSSEEEKEHREAYLERLFQECRICFLSNDCLKMMMELLKNNASIQTAWQYKSELSHGQWPEGAVHRETSPYFNTALKSDDKFIEVYSFSENKFIQLSSVPISLSPAFGGFGFSTPRTTTTIIPFDKEIFAIRCSPTETQLFTYEIDEGWKFVQSITAIDCIPIAHGEYIYIFSKKSKTVHKVKPRCTTGKVCKPSTLTFPLDNTITSVTGFGKYILIFCECDKKRKNDKEETIVQCLDTNKQEWARLNHIEACPKNLIPFCDERGAHYLLQTNGGLWRIKSVFEFQFMKHLWDFELNVVGAVCFKGELWLFANDKLDAMDKNRLWPPELPGVFTKVHTVDNLKASCVLPAILPRELIDNDVYIPVD